MSAAMLTLVVGLAHWWVRLYTSGLPPDIREARRAEIASDLWEQAAGAPGCGMVTTAAEVLARMLLGIPADLSWRFAAGRQRHAGDVPERRVNVNTSLAQRGFVGIAALMAVLYVALGLSNAFVNQEPSFVSRFGEFWGGVLGSLIGFVPAVMIVIGLRAQRRSPLLGGILVLIGAAPLAVGMYWTVVGPVLAVLLVILWASRMRRLGNERKHHGVTP